MTTPLPTLSPGAKAKVASGAAVVLAGVTAYQVATRGGFSWWDLIPVLAAALGTACTDHVENTLTRPAAKAVVHGALSACAAVSAALAALVGPEPVGVSLTKLLVVAAGAFLVWYVPEAATQVAAVEREVQAGAPLGQVAATVAADLSPFMGPDLPTGPATTLAVQPAPALPTA